MTEVANTPHGSAVNATERCAPSGRFVQRMGAHLALMSLTGQCRASAIAMQKDRVMVASATPIAALAGKSDATKLQMMRARGHGALAELGRNCCRHCSLVAAAPVGRKSRHRSGQASGPCGGNSAGPSRRPAPAHAGRGLWSGSGAFSHGACPRPWAFGRCGQPSVLVSDPPRQTRPRP